MCTVQSVVVYASETYRQAVRFEEEQRMERNENVMLRWMCGVTWRDKVPTVELRRRLGIEGVVEAETGFTEVVRACQAEGYGERL